MANGTGEIISEHEAREGGMSEVAIWLKHIERAKDDEEDWRKDANEAIATYEGREVDKKRIHFNILHSNIETVVPALYNSTPSPDVRRRFGDKDPIGKICVDVIERGVSFSVDQYDFDGAMTEAVKDYALVGRGWARNRYEPTMRPMMGPDGQPVMGDDGQPVQEVVYQQISCEHVTWNRWGHAPAERWEKVNWVYFEHDLTYDDLLTIGVDEERAEQLTYDDTKDGKQDKPDKTAGIFKTIKAFEIWDKRKARVLFVTEQDKTAPLAEMGDPLKLPGFFPGPKPLIFTRERGAIRPVCPYKIYAPLVEELESITKRISALVKQLRVRGLIAGKLLADFELLKLCEDGHYEPAGDDALVFAQQGGLEKFIAHWPLEPTVIALKELYVQREQIKQTIYEVSGVSDILRGATDPNETLGAQQLKAQWGGQRVQVRQKDVAEFARDLFRQKAALLCTHFEPPVLSAMTQIDVTPEVMQLLRSDAMRAYRIDIESDSTVRADMSRSQGEMNLFLQGTAQYAQAMAGIIQTVPAAMPVMVEVYTAFARKFKLGKQAEDALEQLSQGVQQQQQQPQGPSPEEQKAEADAKARADEMAMKREGHQLDMQGKTMDLQIKQQAAQIDIGRMQAKAELQAAMPPVNGMRPQ